MLVKEGTINSGQESSVADQSPTVNVSQDTEYQNNALNNNTNTTGSQVQNFRFFRQRSNSELPMRNWVKTSLPPGSETESDFQYNNGERRKRCHSLSLTDLSKNSRPTATAPTSQATTLRGTAFQKYQTEEQSKAQYWVENERENDKNNALWVENECPFHGSPPDFVKLSSVDDISPSELFTDREATDLVTEEQDIDFDEESGKQVSPLNQTWQLDLAEGGFNNVVRGPDFNQDVTISDEMEFYETRRRRFSTRSSSNGSMNYPNKLRSSSLDAGSEDESIICDEKQEGMTPLSSSFAARKSAILISGRRRYRSCTEDITEEENTPILPPKEHSQISYPDIILPDKPTTPRDDQPVSRQRCYTTNSPRLTKYHTHRRKDSDSNLVIPDDAKWGSTALKKFMKTIYTQTELDLSDQKLIDLPSTVPSLTNVQSLQLRGNYIRSLPTSVADMTLLTNLDLSHNHLLHVPCNVKKCTNLKRLCLDRNYLHSLPDFLADLRDLSHISLKGNHFSVWPNVLDKTTQLQYLNMSKNPKLAVIPEGRMCHMNKLHYLLLNGCGLSAIPSDISACDQLHTIDVSNNSLTSLPSTMSAMSDLQSMNLSNNKFKEFPAVICNIPKLHLLDISSNLLEEIPKEVSNLQNLQYMNIQKNKLKYMLPDILCLLLLKRPKLGMVSRRESQQNSFHMADKVSKPRTLQDSNPYI